MNFDAVTLLGLVAATCTTLSFTPQAIKIIKTKKTEDISLWMYVVLTTGTALWLLYGIFTNDLPVTLANIITLILAAAILILKLKYK